MRDCVRELCVLSIFCGASLSLCPEGGVRRVLSLLSTAALLALVLSSLRLLQLDDYPLDLARYRERERQLTVRSGEAREALNRLVIEGEYAAYIRDKAASMGIAVEDVRIGVRWSAEGVWVPESSQMRAADGEQRSLLGAVLEGDLGIPEERQEWLDDG